MEYTSSEVSPLHEIEPRLRDLTPAKLYADVWINPSTRNLVRVFNHLRTLYRILYNYLPRQVIADLPQPGSNRFKWEESTLMFTDLAGFTPLMEKNSRQGGDGADALHKVLNEYFGQMIEIISKAGGNLLEFTGDALLIQFPEDQRGQETNRAVRAGLRMQRVMKDFERIKILDEEFSIKMRVGIHHGKFLSADIGTPHRMEHVLLGEAVLKAKHAESKGTVGRVCLSPEAHSRVAEDFKLEPTIDHHSLVVDSFTADELGDYDIAPSKSRQSSMILIDQSREGLIKSITEAIDRINPLASFIPRPVLNLVVENAVFRRSLPPDFPTPAIVFINLLGIPESLQVIGKDDLIGLVTTFSRLVAAINAEIESRGGVMKKVTYHHDGPDIMAIFGAPNAHTNDVERAVRAANEIQKIVKEIGPIRIGEQDFKLHSHIGVNQGQVFAAEIGDRQGRREFNVLGNTVNTAARLMSHASSDTIFVSEIVGQQVFQFFETIKHENVPLKGRSEKFNVYQLENEIES